MGRGIERSSKAACPLCDLSSLGMDVAVIQETHFVCDINSHVLYSDVVVYSAYRDQVAKGVSLLVKRFLDARMNFVHVNAVDGWPILP